MNKIISRDDLEKAFRDSEDRFRDLAEGSIQGILIHRNFKPLFVNRTYAEIFGFDSPEQIMALDSVLELTGPHTQAQAPADNEYESSRKDGSAIWLDNRVGVISWQSEPATLSTIVDITERKRAEEALHTAHDSLEQRVRERTGELESKIAERERVEKSLRASEDRLTDFAESVSDWFWETDENLRFSYMSPSVERIVGVSPEWHYGKTRQELLGEDYDRDVWDQHFQTLDARQAFRDFTFFQAGEGVKPIWISTSGKPIFGANGNFLGYRGSGRDITEIKQREIAQRDSDERFQAITEASPVPLIITRRSDGTILYANPKVGPAFGLAADEVVGRSIREFYWDFSGREERLAALEKDGYVRDNEVDMRKSDGSRISTIHSLQLIEYQGEAAVLGGFYEITEQKRAEEALRESEERVRGIIDNSPAAIFLKDSEGRYLLVNRKFEDWYGFSASASIGKSTYELFPKHLADAYWAVDRDVIENGKTQEYEFEAIFADGTNHLIAATKFPVRNSQGHIIGVGTIDTDITERKQTEAQLRQAQKMEAVGQLTGGVAHDFNNLLASILGHAEIIEEKLGGDDKSVKTIIHAAERGAQLTQRLLSFSRRQALISKSLDLRDLVGDVHHLLSRTLGETIDIDITMAPSLWNVVADPGQLENALLNLAINARDAMPDGGKLIIETANVSLRDSDAASYMEVPPGDYVSLSVSDTGVGMPPNVLEHAFEPFFTTKDVGEGSGLGLSMVYGFAKQSGGNATIVSEPGHGTTVKLYLPRAEETVERSVTDDLPPLPPPMADGETVLVVEDDSDVRALTEAILENLGYRVLSAEHARAGLDILQMEPAIDLMLSDVVLSGGMSGPDMAEQAKALRPDIRILFMSGYAQQSAHLQSVLPEGCDLLDKPFRTFELAKRVRTALDR